MNNMGYTEMNDMGYTEMNDMNVVAEDSKGQVICHELTKSLCSFEGQNVEEEE